MNYGYNYSNCGCNNCCNPCTFYPVTPGYPGGFGSGYGLGSGVSWFAIVLVVFLLLIICGCTKIS